MSNPPSVLTAAGANQNRVDHPPRLDLLSRIVLVQPIWAGLPIAALLRPG